MGPEKAPEVRVDAALMKLLASDTRRNVLRRLKTRNMTLSELSRALDLKKATVLEHLKRLEEAELIKRREDERLWIYYELTPRARSLVDPVGTRVMIVLGVSLVALLVGASLGLVAQPWLDGTSGGQDTFSVQLDDDEFSSGSKSTVHASFTDPPGSTRDMRGWLLSPDQADRLRAGQAWTPVVTLDLGDHAEGVSLTTPEGVPPGSYHVYLASSDGANNRHDMPLVHVRPPSAELSRADWWQGIDQDLKVGLKDPGETEDDGWLLVSPPIGEPWLEPVLKREATVNASRLDASPPGVYRLHYVGPEEDRVVALSEVFNVHRPRIHVFPPVLLEGEDVQFHVLLDADGPARPSTVPVVIGGQEQQASSETPGRWMLRVDDARPGTIHLQVGRHHEAELTVLPDLQLLVTLEEGPQLRFGLTDRHGDPARGTEIAFNGTRLGTTDTNGEFVRTAPLPEGPGLLRATTHDGHTTAWGVTVTQDGWKIEDRENSLELRDFIQEGLRLDVHNQETWNVSATLVGMLDDQLVGATAIDLDGNETRKVAIPVYSSRTDGREWSVHAEGPPVRPLSYQDLTDPSPPADSPGGGGGDEDDLPPPLFGPRISQRLVDLATTDEGDATPSPPAAGDDLQTAPAQEPIPLPALLVLLVIVLALALAGATRRRKS